MDCISIYAKCNSFSPRFYVLLFTKMGCAMKFIIERWFYRNDAIAIGKVSYLYFVKLTLLFLIFSEKLTLQLTRAGASHRWKYDPTQRAE